MDEDETQWKEDFKSRFSSDFDRLVAFATEMNKSRDSSPKREIETYHNDYHHHRTSSHIKKDELHRKMKNEKSHERDYPADLSDRRIRMMMEEQSRGKHYD